MNISINTFAILTWASRTWTNKTHIFLSCWAFSLSKIWLISAKFYEHLQVEERRMGSLTRFISFHVIFSNKQKNIKVSNKSWFFFYQKNAIFFWLHTVYIVPLKHYSEFFIFLTKRVDSMHANTFNELFFFFYHKKLISKQQLNLITYFER